MLEYEPSLEYKKRKERLEKNPKETVNEIFRLFNEDFEAFETAGGNFEIFEINGPDFERKWGFKPHPAIFVKIQDADAKPFLKYKFAGSRVIQPDELRKSPVLDEMDVVIFSGDAVSRNSEHEALHILWNHASKSEKEIYNLVELYDCVKKNSKEYYEEYLRNLCLDAEMNLLDEISAWRSNLGQKLSERAKSMLETTGIDKQGISEPEWNYENVANWLKSYYVEPLSNFRVKEIANSGILPNCGIVSSAKANTLVKNEMRRYLETKIDEGIKALRILRETRPDSEVTKIVLSIEPTERMGPMDELVLWSKHYKEVLGVGQGGQG